MIRFFVTIWLKGDDSDKDRKLISRIIEKLADDMKIRIAGQINVSLGGNRITIRAESEEDQKDAVRLFTNAIEEKTGHRAKGRLLK